MSKPTIDKVTGAACLNYIDRAIGFCDRSGSSTTFQTQFSYYDLYGYDGDHVAITPPIVSTNAALFSHDTSKRIIGLVLDKCDDGGLHYAVLGNETANVNNTRFFGVTTTVNNFGMPYKHPFPGDITLIQDQDNVKLMPEYDARYNDNKDMRVRQSYTAAYDDTQGRFVSYDQAIGFEPTIVDGEDVDGLGYSPYALWQNQQGGITGTTLTFTNNVNTTCQHGAEINNLSSVGGKMFDVLMDNPLNGCAGNLYDLGCEIYTVGYGLCPGGFVGEEFVNIFTAQGTTECSNMNWVCVPFNLILTESAQEAQAYLTNGTLPSDAWLYPMDWENLPWYNRPDDEDDGDDNNDPDDTSFDGDPNLPVVPSYTPSMLSNYNWYWLQVGEFSNFIQWFWDVGAWNDFSDIVESIMGLYNDLASAILMVRYYPVDISWIGGLGTQSNIIVGMCERSGLVDTISQSAPPAVRDIGHVRVAEKYKSFVDMSPYSQISLYLPFYGFVDLDVNIFTGRDLYVKAVYDYMSGTIQYFIYVDNKFLINTYLAKLAVDIPLTLQTKNDRDSAIFSNVTNALSGLVGAGVTVASGNPMGLLVGAGAMNSGVASAPMRVCGTVGEQGAFYAPPKCALIYRRPTISKPENWARIVGQMCGKDYTLSNLSGKGFTKCYQPRISFSNTSPLQEEVDEIYDLLEKGVIL